MAVFGIQAFKAGVKTLDTSYRVTRFHGSIEKIPSLSGIPAGSQNVPSLAEGTPFFWVEQSVEDYYDRVVVTLSGTTLSWSFSQVGFTIYYGTR